MIEIDLVNNDYQIFDDWLPEQNQNKLTSLFSNLPWYFRETTCEKEAGEDHEEYYLFEHWFIYDGKSDSHWTKAIDLHLFQNIPNEKGISRCKANMTFNYGKITKPNLPHIDDPLPHYVGLYYVDDSDGDTILYNKDKSEMVRVSPKKGRMVFFKGDILHSSSHPYKYKKRTNININFIL